MSEDKKNKKRISVSDSEKVLLWQEKEVAKAYDQKTKKDIKPFLIFAIMAFILGGIIFYYSSINDNKEVAKDNKENKSEVIDNKEEPKEEAKEEVEKPKEEAKEESKEEVEKSEKEEPKEDQIDKLKEEEKSNQAEESKDDKKEDIKSENLEESKDEPKAIEIEEPKPEVIVVEVKEPVEETKKESVKSPAIEYRKYKVQPQDTFYNIATRIYNDSSKIESIKSLNGITTLKSGTILKLSPYKNRSMSSYAPRYYKVKSGETLYSVSMKFYKTQRLIEAIKMLNNIEDETLKAGTTIQLP